MTSRLLRLTLATAALVAATLPALAAGLNDNARYLAGLQETPDAQLKTLFKSTDQTWAGLKERRLESMQGFARAQFAHEHESCETLFYPFSGPDALNALAFFPNCKQYVLFGLEPVGALPDMSAASPAQVKLMLQAMAKAQEYLVRRNFFVTQYMGRDLRSSQLNGVVPLMSVMLVRLGYELRDVELKEVDGSARSDVARQTPHAVQLTFGKPGGPDQHLFYANFDASDAGLKARPDFLSFIKPKAPTVTMLKAASYLLHADEFKTMRETVLSGSSLIVQDDTGVPYSAMQKAGFDVKLFGHYAKPIDVFGYRFQKDLSAAYAKLDKQSDLGFEWSYNYKPSEMGLQLARKAH